MQILHNIIYLFDVPSKIRLDQRKHPDHSPSIFYQLNTLLHKVLELSQYAHIFRFFFKEKH